MLTKAHTFSYQFRMSPPKAAPGSQLRGTARESGAHSAKKSELETCGSLYGVPSSSYALCGAVSQEKDVSEPTHAPVPVMTAL